MQVPTNSSAASPSLESSPLAGRPVRVMLVDDHILLRTGLRRLLAGHPDVEVVAECDNGLCAIAAAEAGLIPDVVVMDLVMPGMDGLATARRLAEIAPAARVLFLTAYADERAFAAAMDAVGGTSGASAAGAGFLDKTCSADELAQAVRRVAAGGRWIHAPAALTAPAALGGVAALTERERQVLLLLAEGKVNKEAAAVMGVSVKTVETHRHKVMAKLGLDGIADLTRYAVRHGLVPLDVHERGWTPPGVPHRNGVVSS